MFQVEMSARNLFDRSGKSGRSRNFFEDLEKVEDLEICLINLEKVAAPV